MLSPFSGESEVPKLTPKGVGDNIYHVFADLVVGVVVSCPVSSSPSHPFVARMRL